MKLKLIYTGDPTETKIVNAETGESVEGVHSVEVSIDAFQGYAVLILQDFITEIDNMEAETVHAEGNDKFIGTRDN
jgi:hypothetical protein